MTRSRVASAERRLRRRPHGVVRRTRRLLRLALPLLLTTLVGLPAQAAEKTLTELTQAYEAHLGPSGDVAYEGQRRVLTAIAEQRSDEARATLMRLLERYGEADRQRAALLLSALVRYGSPQELDRVIDYVEARKDPLLLDWLHMKPPSRRCSSSCASRTSSCASKRWRRWGASGRRAACR